MQNLFRRPSGIYVLRIAVPAQLRQVFNKREIIASTGTRELAIAKMVAGAQATQWRQRFFDSVQLLLQKATLKMDHQEILKIAHGHPVLLTEGHLSIRHASNASGIDPSMLLRKAGDGTLPLFYRAGPLVGYLLQIDKLELTNPEIGRTGGFVIPTVTQMAENAIPHLGQGLLKIPVMDIPGITAALLAGDEVVALLAFELPEKPGMLFIPNDSVNTGLDGIVVATSQVETLRKAMAMSIGPERINEAKNSQMIAMQTVLVKAGKRANERLSIALDAYISTQVRQDVAREGEIKRIKNGCALLIELEGDVTLAEIDTGRLRQFRNQKLSHVPANENKIRLIHGTRTVTESIKQIEGSDWPIMSSSERNKRMNWICAWFRWLAKEKWISEDPAAAIQGENVLTKAERKKDKKVSGREDEARDPFTSSDLAAIFGAPWFQTGHGTLTKKGTYRTFMPLYYWLPLLGLYIGGGRINELCQLHLTDIKKTESGQWYVDFNESSPDQDLKTTQSKRIVPLHPHLLTLGFDKWHLALTVAGYKRLFPELKHNSEKGYGKGATKWFTNYMANLGIPRDGKKTFHSFRHTYINALPDDIPERMRKQLTGHIRGNNAQDRTYRKDVTPENAASYVARLEVSLPTIAPFDIEAGLIATANALERKNRGLGADEDTGEE